jgi:hypothetical protein
MRQGITVVVCGALLLSACASPTPPIAQGLPKVFVPTADFDARVRQRFPIGSSEDTLIAELRAEKFTITEIIDPSDQYRRNAYYESQIFPCKETWAIKWAADQGQITAIQGRNSGELCL